MGIINTRFFRGVVVLLLFALFGIGAIFIGFCIFPVICIFAPVEKRRKYCCDVIHKAWNFFSNTMQKTGTIRLKLNNPSEFEKIINNEGCGKIIVANHPSFIDIVLLIGLFPNTVCMAKKELKKNFFMRNIVKTLYLINDEDNDKLVKDAIGIMQEGFNIVIFPTGTRTTEDENLKLHKGAAFLALHSGCDIVPINISCSYKFLAKNQKVYDAGIEPVEYLLTVNETIKISDFIRRNSSLSDIQLRNRVNNEIKEKLTKVSV